MKKRENFRFFIQSVIFSVSVLAYLTFSSTTERVAMVCASILLYKYGKCFKGLSVKKIYMASLAILLSGVIFYVGLFQLRYTGNRLDDMPKGDSSEKVAVLLVFSGEPVQYNLPIIINNKYKNMTVKRTIGMPFELHRVKRAYESLGVSRYNEKSIRIHKKVEDLLKPHYEVLICYHNDIPYYQEELSRIISLGGYKKVIIAPISLTDSSDYLSIAHGIGVPSLSKSQADIQIMSPLWDSEKLPKAVVNSIIYQSDRYSKSDVGVLLLSMSEESNQINLLLPQSMKQELRFMEKMKELLVERGFEKRKIRINQTHLEEHEIKEIIKELKVYGVGTIFLVTTSDIACKIEQRLQIINLIRDVEASGEIRIIFIEGWGEDHLFIEELESRIRLLNIQD